MNPNTRLKRRELLKVLAAAAGGSAISSFLPGKWIRPAITTGVLPAHAQASPQCLVGDSVSIVATTSTQINGVYADFDLMVRTPDGSLVTPESPGPQQGALHHGDNINQAPPVASESLSINGPANGTYQIGVRYYLVDPGPNLDITVSILSGNCNFLFQRTIVDDSPSDPMHIADIVYPAGTVIERSGGFGAARRSNPAGKND